MEGPLQLYMGFHLTRDCSWVSCIFTANGIAILTHVPQDNPLKGILLNNAHFIEKIVQRD